MNNFNENNIKKVEQSVVKTVPENVVVETVEKEEKAETKNNALNIIIGTIVVAGILVVLFYLGRGIMDKQNKIVVESENKVNMGEIILNGNTCYDLKDYYVVTRDEINEPGEDILIKYNKDNTKYFKCEYTVEEGDFELKNIRIENSATINFVQYYSYLQDNKLIVDSGTGIKRKLQIYDLNTREKVFTDDYNLNQVGLDLKENTLTYWRTTKDIPNKENCSKVEEYRKMGGAQIETKVSLNLNNLTKKEFSEFRCSYVE